MDRLRVAVTGVGGGGGQSIIKALKMAAYNGRNLPDIEIFPVDVTPFSAGLYSCRNSGTVLPKPEEDISAWLDWVLRLRINAIIPGSDRDLMPLARVRDHLEDCQIMVSDRLLVQIGDDKWETVRALRAIGFDAPVSFTEI